MVVEWIDAPVTPIDVLPSTAEDVHVNWERLKAVEKVRNRDKATF